MKKKQIGVALSGGVDSTACALQLMKHHEVQGFFMRLAGHDLNEQEQKARAIADQLGITFQVIDLSREFTQSILHYFTATYQQGRTPNPCVVCNQVIKFGLLLDAVLARGMEAMATGHYARITRDGEVWQLRKGCDTTKDQSYFLARLNQQQLSRCLFPLGEQKKNGIYQIVEDQGITGLRGQESQDICFLSSTTVGDFLKERIPLAEQNGEIITGSGQILGKHHGLFHYTIGQRRGLGLSDTTPWYVTRLDAKSNSVVVGKEEELYCGSLLIHYPHWLVAQAPKENQKYQVKIRYRHQAVDAQIKMINEQCWRIEFDTPQRAVTPGQFAVIYEDDQVLGCGEIET